MFAAPRGSGAVLAFAFRTSTSGDGGVRALSVVRAAVARVGVRAVVGRCGGGTGLGGAQAENGSAGRGALAASAAGKSVSEDLGAEPGSARWAAIAGASSQAGAGPDAHQEPAAGHGVEPGSAEKWKLWTKLGRAELEQLPLLPYAAERRQRLLETLDGLEADLVELNRQVEGEVRKRPEAMRLRTHPGVGPVTAFAMVLTLGPTERFASGKEVGSYFGLIPREDSSGGKQRLGQVSKQRT